MFPVLKAAVKYSLPHIVVRWIARRKNYKLPYCVPFQQRKPALHRLLLLLPYWVTVPFLMVKSNDRTIAKYFLPYGYMRKKVIAKYGADYIPFRNGLPPAVARFRAVLPYGIVRWWDEYERPRLMKGKAVRASVKKVAVAKKAAPKPSVVAGATDLRALRAVVTELSSRLDSIELLQLQILELLSNRQKA